MLKLVIARAETIPPPIGKTDIEVWRDNDGAVCAYGQVLGDEHWMHLPGLASFRFSRGGNEVTAIVPSGFREDLIVDAYYRSVLPMALQVGGREVLHASAVRTPFGVLALCGVSETGKSTIAFGLSRRGYALWADDAVAFEMSPSGATVVSLPFAIRLRPSSAELFNVDATQAPAVDATAFGADTAPLLAVCVLRRLVETHDAISPVAVRRLSSSQALVAVLTHAYSFTFEKEYKRRMMEHYLKLAADVPIFEVCFRTGLAHVPSILDAIEHVLGENAPPKSAA